MGDKVIMKWRQPILGSLVVAAAAVAAAVVAIRQNGIFLVAFFAFLGFFVQNRPGAQIQQQQQQQQQSVSQSVVWSASVAGGFEFQMKCSA